MGTNCKGCFSKKVEDALLDLGFNSQVYSYYYFKSIKDSVIFVAPDMTYEYYKDGGEELDADICSLEKLGFVKKY